MLMPSREEIETLGSAELRDLLEMVESVISERLDAPEAPNPREGYFTEGCGREVAQRDAELAKHCPGTPHRGHTREENSCPLEPAQQPAGVKLYRTLEVLEYMSATLLVIDGAMYRIGCMGGDVEDRRPLMLLPVSLARAPRWASPENVRAGDWELARRLEIGDRIKISGTVYEVSFWGGWELKLIAVR